MVARKIIPGVQISTYDVGGTQSYQHSALLAHGSSTNDVSYNIDGSTVNWPGLGLTKWAFLGNPINRLYDFNLGGGGAS